MSVRRILFASGSANLGGLQSSTHSRILGLRAMGVESEKLFLKPGAGVDTYSDVPHHITRNKEQMRRLVEGGNFDAISMINRIDLLEVLNKVGYRGRVLYEVRGRAKHALRVLARLRPGQVGAIVVISNYVRELVRGVLQGKRIPIVVVKNCVNTELFAPSSDIQDPTIPFAADASRRPIVLWVGRLTKNKNYTEMLRVANIMQRQAPQPIFWVVADTRAKDNKQAFRAAVSALDLYGHVRLLECIPHHKMPEVYNLVRMSGGCVLSTSVSEGFQNSLLEGMACGVPVVSSPAGGNTELLIDGVNGRLYELGKPAQAAQALRELLSDEALRERYTRAGLRRIRARHTPEMHAKSFLLALQSVSVSTYPISRQPMARRTTGTPQKKGAAAVAKASG